ncbi:MAG: hypothetical protein JXM70_12430 [Pirellulales bacterium]|nr:hypothetical protein [Pirellulales bacterium]
MNSNQRVREALTNGRPDRPPLGFFAIDADTAAKVLGRETYWRAKARCQIAFWEGRRDEVVQSWIEDATELYRKLDVIDIIPVCCDAAGMAPPRNYDPDPPRKVDENTWEDRQGCVYKYSPQTKDITMVHDPQMWTREHAVEEELYDGESPLVDESVFEAIDAIIDNFKQDRFILGPSGGEMAWLLLGGMERGMMEVAARPQDVKQIYLSHVKRAHERDDQFIRPGQDGVLWGQDLASQNGPMISPQTYRELFFDGFRSRIEAVKKKNQFVIKHACGDNRLFFDIFVDLGIDCYQSIQASAGMDIVEIQRDWGDKFAVWGGIPVEHLLVGTADDVRADVDRFMREVAPAGRCILGTSHSVAVGSKYDNFMALLDQFDKHCNK